MLTKAKQEQVKEVYRYALTGILGHLFATIILISVLAGNVSSTLLIKWTFFIWTILFLRIASLIIYKKTKQDINPDLKLDKWVFIYQLGVFFTGISWGAITFLFADQFHIADLHFIMLAIVFGLAGAGIATLGSVFSIYALFTIPMFIMTFFDFISTDKPAHLETGALSLIGMFYLLYTALNHSNKSFDVIQRTHQVERTQADIVERLSKAGEFRDDETGLHVKRMSYSSYLLALEAGLSKKQSTQILAASPMHDIGKIGIPDSILLKPGKLTRNEWKTMQAHTTIGTKILDNHESELLQLAAVIAGNHHEKWDGTGYPKGLSGNNIPIEARIVSICDVFDALISVRPYKEAWSIEDALTLIKKNSGSYFDPKLVAHFLSITDQVIEYSIKHQNKPPENRKT